MRYRTLGRTGVEVSEVGFGGAGAGLKNYLRRWDPTQEEQSQAVEQAIRRAVELGINYFDTAPKYDSELMFGRALKPYRDRVFLASKVWAYNADQTLESIEDSLERLQMDYLDLIQFHGDWYHDEEVENILKPDGMLTGMQAARDAGLARFTGLTAEGVNGNLSRLIATGAFDVLQIQYNVMFQGPCDPSKESGVMYEAEGQEMGIAIMRPFTGGTFPKWLQWVYPEAEARGDLPRLMASLLSFVLSNPLTDVALVGMRSVARVEQNCAIADNLDSRIDLDALYGRFLRKLPGSDEEVWLPTSGRQSDDVSQDY
jgi:aryl-alcohol dehydrogenase-like predicted oxidoreductase